MEKQLYIFRNLDIVKDTIAVDFIEIYESGLNTKQRIFLHFTRNGGVYENYERLTHDIKLYFRYKEEKECCKILKCVLFIASLYTKYYPILDHSNFEHILSYRNNCGIETYTLKGLKYMNITENISKYRYTYNLDNDISSLIKYMLKCMFGEECKVFEKTKQIEKENNMEIFVSKKKKDESLYLVFKNPGKAEAKTIKLPNELKKAFEKSALLKLNDGKVLSVLPNIIYLYCRSCNIKLDAKSTINSWLPEEKYRKMLFVSFVLLQIKIKSKHVNINKDIFEKFKLTDTKASYDKLYDIADLLIKIKLDKCKYDAMKHDFSLK